MTHDAHDPTPGTIKYPNDGQLADAYDVGFGIGSDIVSWNQNDIPTFGQPIPDDHAWAIEPDETGIYPGDIISHAQVVGMFTTYEVTARGYSPFEFIAADFNRQDDPTAFWDAYEAGVEAGITVELAERGIHPEPER
jgi:hypothetical protein